MRFAGKNIDTSKGPETGPLPIITGLELRFVTALA